MKYGSLFSGIGGFDLGLHWAGMNCAWQVEKDEYCRAVLAKHWPDVRRYEDVREVGKWNLEPVDLICGGFPCQPHSKAGKRRGAADDRNLWPEFKRIIAEIRPRWVLAENVTGIRTTMLDGVLSDLEGLGYSWQTAIIPACAVDARHRRDRVWIVAYSQKQRQRPGLRTREPGKRRKRRLSDIRSEAAARITTCKGCGEDWCNWHGYHRFECGCPDPWDESDEPNFGWWAIEPGMGRMAHGIPNRVDRLRSLGNAVVPQVVEFIGRLIMEADKVTE